MVTENDTLNVCLLSDDKRQPCEVWTRVMGYHRPVASFNRGKQSEHAERLHFREEHTASGPGACEHRVSNRTST